MARALLDWDKVRLAIIERHEQLERRGIHRISIRFLHYYFKQERPELGVGRPVNPYKELDAHITKWKKDAKSGIKREWFVDRSRPDATDVQEDTPEGHARYYANAVLNALDNFSEYRWFKQPIYVEIWVEKDTMASIIEDMVSDLGIRVVICKGYIGDTKLGEHTKRLAEKQASGRKIIILYLGDLDPSGENMSDIMQRRIDEIRTTLDVDDPDRFELRRVAVLDEHIEKFDLTKLGPQPEPGKKDDADTKRLRESLQDDPRADRFRANHNDELFCVELDAMVSDEAIDELEKIVRGEIEKLFDDDIYQKYANILSAEQAGKWLVKKLDAALNKVRDDWLGDGEEEPLKAPDDYAEGSSIEQVYLYLKQERQKKKKEELGDKSERFTEEEEAKDLQNTREELAKTPYNPHMLKKLSKQREQFKEAIRLLEAGEVEPSRLDGYRSVEYYRKRLSDIEAAMYGIEKTIIK